VDNVSFINNDILSINIGTLTGKNINNSYASLSWNSSGELANDIFKVERSDDNVHYSLIGSVKATHGTGTHTYTFRDDNFLSGTNYYRVKQVSSGGEFKYSNVLPLSFNTYTFNIYPNPARTQIFLRYGDDLGAGRTITVQLINSAGQVVYQHNITAQGAANTIVLDIPSSIASGMYLVQAVNEKGEKRTRNVFIER
jgi:hypothetical protein